jgi:hypothetical protein
MIKDKLKIKKREYAKSNFGLSGKLMRPKPVPK